MGSSTPTSMQSTEDRGEKRITVGDLACEEATLASDKRSRWRSVISQYLCGATVEEDPKYFSTLRKTVILFIIALSGLISPINSTIYYPALPVIQRELNASAIAVNATVSSFTIFMAIFPLIWATLSEGLGTRRLILMVGFIIHIVASCICASLDNVYALLVVRALQATGGSAPQSLGAAIVCDVWEPKERGTAFGMYYIGPLLGPIIGPVIGGVLTAKLSWRFTFYFAALMGAVTLILIIFFLPETYRKPPTLASSTPAIKHSIFHQLKLFNPLRSLALIRYRFVLLAAFQIGSAFIAATVLNLLIPTRLAPRYKLDSTLTGLTYIGLGVGCVFGSVVGGRLSDYFVRKRAGDVVPEDRLGWHVWAGSFLFVPAGALVYGWLLDTVSIVFLPLIGHFFVGLGIMLVFTGISTYLVDSMPSRTASITAVNNFVRNLMAAVSALFAQPLVEALGDGWLAVLLAGINVLAGLLLLLVKRYGAVWRERVPQ
ncbi:uncharacterized protein VTP21DRAFT_11715 [Calcarisporiella thermophila]|uniref:uncharacterized protein n=1 Tax=Calcarisporiella thermophila TaxID=911321 RepID=UPI0037442CBE